MLSLVIPSGEDRYKTCAIFLRHNKCPEFAIYLILGLNYNHRGELSTNFLPILMVTIHVNDDRVWYHYLYHHTFSCSSLEVVGMN